MKNILGREVPDFIEGYGKVTHNCLVFCLTFCQCTLYQWLIISVMSKYNGNFQQEDRHPIRLRMSAHKTDRNTFDGTWLPPSSHLYQDVFLHYLLLVV